MTPAELKALLDAATPRIELLECENTGLLVRVSCQERVIADLRRELEMACRRIVELERGEGDGA